MEQHHYEGRRGEARGDECTSADAGHRILHESSAVRLFDSWGRKEAHEYFGIAREYSFGDEPCLSTALAVWWQRLDIHISGQGVFGLESGGPLLLSTALGFR